MLGGAGDDSLARNAGCAGSAGGGGGDAGDPCEAGVAVAALAVLVVLASLAILDNPAVGAGGASCTVSATLCALWLASRRLADR